MVENAFIACFFQKYVQKLLEKVPGWRSDQDDKWRWHMTFMYKGTSWFEKSKATVMSQGQRNIFTLQKTRTDKLSWQQFSLPKHYLYKRRDPGNKWRQETKPEKGKPGTPTAVSLTIVILKTDQKKGKGYQRPAISQRINFVKNKLWAQA